MTPLEEALASPPFGLAREDKNSLMLKGLANLTDHHREHCAAYARMIEVMVDSSDSHGELTDIPFLPVQIFKRIPLASVPPEEIVRTLTSSGTSGQIPSRIFLDRETASLQSRILVRIAGEIIGKQRMPMLVIDDNSFLKDRSAFNARAAGIIGFSSLGRNHLYLLDKNLEPDWSILEDFINDHRDGPILLFGFTFIVWQSFVVAAWRAGRQFTFPRGSVLIHGGGWKRLEDQRVTADEFKAALAMQFGIDRVHNYYGMVEQVGSVYFECEAGKLHTPAYSDILIRSPVDLSPLEQGETGLIQVLSLLPRSYPGHSILTEDLGRILGEDDCECGRLGKNFEVHGRLKNVEARGCSDTRTLATAA